MMNRPLVLLGLVVTIMGTLSYCGNSVSKVAVPADSSPEGSTGVKKLKADHILQPNSEAVQCKIQEEMPFTSDDFFNEYQPYDKIVEFFAHFCDKNSDIVWCSDIGTSVEGRPIQAVVIAGEGAERKSKDQPMVFLNFASHAREWITHMAAPFVAKALVREYREGTSTKRQIDGVAVAIVYIQNPDGYVYSWTEGTFSDDGVTTPNRFWRKNRAPGSDGKVIGVDPLFNYDWDMWETLDGDYAKPEALMYKGPEPFSEPETRAVRDFIRARPGMTRAMIDFHSFSQYIMWNNDKTETSKSLALEMKKNVEALYGVSYSEFQAANGLDKWVAENSGYEGVVPAFTVEMRPNDACGFELPKEQIVPASTEALEMSRVLLKYVAKSIPHIDEAEEQPLEQDLTMSEDLAP